MPTRLTLSLLRGGPEGIAEWNRLRVEGAKLPKFNGGNLHHTNLAGANLSGAWLKGADLDSADLTGTNLAGTIFTGAFINHAKIDAKWFEPDAEVYGLPVIVGGA